MLDWVFIGMAICVGWFLVPWVFAGILFVLVGAVGGIMWAYERVMGKSDDR